MGQAIRVYKNADFDNVVMIIMGNHKVDRKEKDDNIIKLFNHDQLIGINIFDKALLSDLGDGFVFPTQNVLSELNEYLSDFGFEKLSFDNDCHLHVAEVLEVANIEGADTLHMCRVQTKDAVYDIVCGAANVREGLKTIVALDQAVLYNGTLIEKGEVFGNASAGMLCSAKELGLFDVKQQTGIIELNDTVEVGLGFSEIDWSEY